MKKCELTIKDPIWLTECLPRPIKACTLRRWEQQEVLGISREELDLNIVRRKMGAGCTKEAKGGVIDLQNGNVPATPRSPAKTNVKTEGDE